MKKVSPLLSVVLLLLLVIPVTLPARQLRFAATDGNITLTENGEPIYTYQKEMKSLGGKYARANYLHPVYGLGGEVLTEDFPEDHLHHRGIFWAWHQLIAGGEKLADPWECRGIEWKVKSTDTRVENNIARLEVTVEWIAGPDGRKKTYIEERTQISCYPTSGYRILDFQINLRAPGDDVWLGGSEDSKGYGGFSARLKLSHDVRFVGEKGEVQPETKAVKAGSWVNVLSASAGKPFGVVVMNDPEAKPFHGWILRNKDSMQNAAFPGRKPIKLKAGETLTLRYRLLIHTQNMTTAEIEEQFRQFAESTEKHKK